MEWCYNSPYDTEYLMHYGTNGMKWGIRRYQYKDGTLTPEGRIRYRVTDTGDIVKRDRKEIKQIRKDIQAEKAEAKRQRRLQVEQEKTDEKKARLLKEKNPADIFENKDLFTDQELLAVYNRMNLERNVSSLVPKEKEKTYSDAVDRLAKNVGSTANLIKKGSEFYNSVAEIANAAGADLPVVGKERKEPESAKQKEVKRLKEENEHLTAITNNYKLKKGYKNDATLTPDETEELLRKLRNAY